MQPQSTPSPFIECTAFANTIRDLKNSFNVAIETDDGTDSEQFTNIIMYFDSQNYWPLLEEIISALDNSDNPSSFARRVEYGLIEPANSLQQTLKSWHDTNFSTLYKSLSDGPRLTTKEQFVWHISVAIIFLQTRVRHIENVLPKGLPATKQQPAPATVITILPDARLSLIDSLLPYIESEQHKSLEDLINKQSQPTEPIVCQCEQVTIGRIFYDAVKDSEKENRAIQSDKTKIAKWICEHFRRNEAGTVKGLSYNTILNYLKGKGFAHYQ